MVEPLGTLWDCSLLGCDVVNNSDYISSNRFVNEQLIWKDVKGSDHDVIWGTIPAHRRDGRKSRKPSFRIDVVSRTARVQISSITDWASYTGKTLFAFIYSYRQYRGNCCLHLVAIFGFYWVAERFNCEVITELNWVFTGCVIQTALLTSLRDIAQWMLGLHRVDVIHSYFCSFFVHCRFLSISVLYTSFT